MESPRGGSLLAGRTEILDGALLAAVITRRYTARFPQDSSGSLGKVSRIMVHRPRTKLKLARKAARCPKCGKLCGMRVRCKTCHKKLRD